MNPAKVRGKVVVCLRGGNSRADKGGTVLAAGGIAMVLANDEASGDEVMADAHLLPATHISFTAGEEVLKYIETTK